MTTAEQTAAVRSTGLLAGRRGLVLGVVNQRSIAWGIAERLAAEGAELGFTYRSRSAGLWLERATPRLGGDPWLGRCDVTDDAELAGLGTDFARSAAAGADSAPKIDFIVHAVAHGNREELAGGLAATSRKGFTECMESSVYSLIGVVQALRPHLSERASILTLSYLGSERVCHGYNVLGVAKAALESSARYLAAELGPHGTRVNVLSAGPMRTLATFGLPNFSASLAQRAERSPLGRSINTADVAGTALYLLSDLSSGVTGETVYVDAGYHIMGTWPGDPGDE
ncbi:enoyl-ACP reductase [Streptacidiphilus sp. EB103A]|uniref:enoyl-ACP reductase FabI n=1 Tax=Streptacidiphilus sp. EB103A TaxID=3156275 RepID=UPI0035197477